MSHDLLRTWLQLSAHAWPPDHYTLLGLQPGEGVTDEIEKRVLERMDLLRRYQLLHPEQVTEGMNRLAQAMNCLLDAEARQQYDLKLNLKPVPSPNKPEQRPFDVPAPPVVVESPRPSSKPARPTVIGEGGSPSRPTKLLPPGSMQPGTEKVYAPGDEPPVVKVYSLEDEPMPLPEDRNDTVFVEEEDEPLEIDRIKDFEEPLDEEKPARRNDPELRRPLYAELVRIRRVLRLWVQLRTPLMEPEKAFQRRAETVAFMTTLTELRPLLPSVADLIGGPNQPGNLIATLAKQTLVVEMFRSLLPSQRESLAQDCRTAHYRLIQKYEEIRREIRRQTAKNLARGFLYPTLRALVRSPEWIMLGLGCAALAIALVRSLPE